MYIDAHCHIDTQKNLKELVARARKEGVKIILNNGVNAETNRKTLQLCEKFPEVRAALGIYPIDGLKMSEDEFDKEVEFIRKNKNKIVAIGEVGLDRKENLDNFDEQKENFGKMIKLSLELNKPIIVHSRKAEKECIEMLEEMKAKKVIMHCFSGNLKLVERIIRNKWTFTIPASVKHSEHFQLVIKMTPMEQLLCETDSPFLHPDKKFPNEPALVVESYKKISEIKKMSLEDVEKKFEKNFGKLLG